MADKLGTALLLSAVLSPAIAPPLAEARTKQPKSTVLCLPPGGNPTPCDVVSAGTGLLVTLPATTSPVIYFAELSSRRKSRLIEMPLQSAWQIRPGVYRLALPPSLCAGRKGSSRYEIQTLVPGFKLRETVQPVTLVC